MMLGRELETMFPARGPVTGSPLLRVERLLLPGLSEPISFEVRPGEIVGLTGQLGSGASAVVNSLAGMFPPSSGKVFLEDEEVSLGGRAMMLARGVAYCSADRKRDGIFAGRSIRENISSPWIRSVARLGWISARHERERAGEIARRFAIDVKRLGSGVGTLSGGNQQKVAVGKWLGVKPRVMLLDEPTRGVDIGARAEIYQRLRDLCAAGMGIVVASSDTAEILGISDTIITLYRGRVTACKRQEDWTEDALVREVMHQESAT
jgi:ribose transport system ATP-binding protein